MFLILSRYTVTLSALACLIPAYSCYRASSWWFGEFASTQIICNSSWYRNSSFSAFDPISMLRICCWRGVEQLLYTTDNFATRFTTNFLENIASKCMIHDLRDLDEKSSGVRSSFKQEQILPCSGPMRDHGNWTYGTLYTTGVWRIVWDNASRSAWRAASSLLSVL